MFQQVVLDVVPALELCVGVDPWEGFLEQEVFDLGSEFFAERWHGVLNVLALGC